MSHEDDPLTVTEDEEIRWRLPPMAILRLFARTSLRGSERMFHQIQREGTTLGVRPSDELWAALLAFSEKLDWFASWNPSRWGESDFRFRDGSFFCLTLLDLENDVGVLLGFDPNADIKRQYDLSPLFSTGIKLFSEWSRFTLARNAVEYIKEMDAKGEWEESLLTSLRNAYEDFQLFEAGLETGTTSSLLNDCRRLADAAKSPSDWREPYYL